MRATGYAKESSSVPKSPKRYQEISKKVPTGLQKDAKGVQEGSKGEPEKESRGNRDETARRPSPTRRGRVSVVGRLVHAGPVPVCDIGQWASAIMATRTCAALRAPVARPPSDIERPTERPLRAFTWLVRSVHDRSDLWVPATRAEEGLLRFA